MSLKQAQEVVGPLLDKIEPEFIKKEHAQYQAAAQRQLDEWLTIIAGPQPQGNAKRADGTWKDDPGVFLMRENEPRYSGYLSWETKKNATWIIDQKRVQEDADKSVRACLNYLYEKLSKQLHKIAGNQNYAVTGELAFKDEDIGGTLTVVLENGAMFEWNVNILRKWRSVKPLYQFPITFQNIVLPDGTKYDIRSFGWMAKNL